MHDHVKSEIRFRKFSNKEEEKRKRISDTTNERWDIFYFSFCSATFNVFCDAQFVPVNDLTGVNYPFQRNGRQFIRCPENLFHRIVAEMTIRRS